MNPEVKSVATCPAGYKQTEVGVIPSDWEVRTVGQAFEICNQLRLPISQKVRAGMIGPYPYYGPTSVQGWINEYRVNGEYSLIGEDGDHFLKWTTHPMTLLVSGKFNVNNHAHLVRGIQNDTKWFFWFFRNRDISPHLTRQGAGRYKLTKAALLEIPCALPPTRSEQEAVVKVLSDTDLLIESLEQLIAKNRQIKQGAMQELLTGKRRLSGFDAEWSWVPMASLGQVFGGLSGKTKANFGHGGSRYIPFMNVMSNTVIDTDWLERVDVAPKESQNLVQAGDLFFNGSSETPEEVGYCSVLKRAVDHLYLNSFCFGFRPKVQLNGLFLAYWFRSIDGRQAMSLLAQGATRYNIAKSAFLKLPVPQPQVEEQDAIASVLSDMDAEIAALESKLAKARQLKQGMMHELLTGRIRLV